jgi:hypothetical protein
MITLSKGMIGLAALIAAGVVGVGSLTDARPQSPASAIADRFVFTVDVPAPNGQGVDLTTARRDAAEALAAVTLAMDVVAKKGDRLDTPRVAAACGQQTWPNIASECLVSEDGVPVRRPTRYVTVERHTAPSASELVRYLATDVASR